MENKKKLKLFIHFLKKERIYSQYLDALKNDKNYRRQTLQHLSPSLFIAHHVKYSPQFLISSAFDWSDYQNITVGWAYIDEKWKRLLSKHGYYDYNF